MKLTRPISGCVIPLVLIMAFFLSCSEDNPGKWRFPGEDWLAFGFIAVSENGTVYAGTENTGTDTEHEHSLLYSLSPDGEEHWNVSTAGRMSYPVIGSEGAVLVSNYDDRIFSFSAAGGEEWSFGDSNAGADPTGYSHAVGIDGTIYLASRSDLYAVNEDGDLEWAVAAGGDYDIPEPGLMPPVIDGEGRIYTAFHRSGPGSTGTTISGLNSLGVREWFLEIDGEELCHPPAVGPGGQLYASSASRLYSIRPDGGISWEFSYPATGTITPPEPSQPVVGADGTVYLIVGYPYEASTDVDDVTAIYALSATGAVKWERELESFTSSTPVVGRDGKLYLASGSFLYSFLEDGTPDWSEDVKKDISGFFPLTMGCDGTVYVSVPGAHKLIAVETGSPGPARSSWPMFGHDPRHTGNQATGICP